MFKLNSKVEETKAKFMVNLKEIIEESKLLAVCCIGAGCLTTGYILGAITTSTMYKSFSPKK